MQACFRCALMFLALLTVSLEGYVLNDKLENIGIKPKRYNITASDQHNFVWFRVAKVGTRTIYQILRENNVPYSIKGVRIPFVAEEHKKQFKFAFVRNPWARVVSCYHDKVVNKALRTLKKCYDKDFDFFVDFLAKKDLTHCDVHFKLQTALFPFHEMDFIGRMENFKEDLQYVLKQIGIDCPRIPHRNVSSHEHYSHYYNERTKAIIEELYRADIEAFGYDFEQK